MALFKKNNVDNPFEEVILGNNQAVEAGASDNGIFDSERLMQAEAEVMGDGSIADTSMISPVEYIGKEQIAEAMEILQKYKNGKAELESRIVNEETFYMGQQYKRVWKDNKKIKDMPSSGWLFNALHSKHADAMDNIPETICLPREPSDSEEAERLTSILPVIYEQANFEKVYSDAWWYKLKHGVSAMSVMWDSTKQNGLGDIVIGRPDILNLYWAPGVTDIQDSPNFFAVDLVDNKALEEEYPKLRGRLGGTVFDYKLYAHNNVDLSEKTLVVDWYYKKKYGTKTILHYCRFIEGTVLYASENDDQYRESGYYDHGLYPFVFDVLFPEEGTPVGFGIISVAMDPQIKIDIYSNSIMEYAKKASKIRYMAKQGAGIDEKEWNDEEAPIVHVQGANIVDEAFKLIDVPSIDSFIVNERDAMIDELKQTTANLDFSQGTTTAGVTSGAAIATLQEAGNKTTRDMIKASYRRFVEMSRMVIENIRQFYTDERTFRIKNPNGVGFNFVSYTNQNLQAQPQFAVGSDGQNVPIIDEFGEQAVRIPIIDIDVRAQKQSPFTTMAQNETAMNLYNAGFFEPERAQQSLIALEMMDFEGKEKIVEYVTQGQTLLNQVNQLGQMLAEANAQIAVLTGKLPIGAGVPQTAALSSNVGGNPEGIMPDVAKARTTPYMQDLMRYAKV
jgi:hypothetical protein